MQPTKTARNTQSAGVSDLFFGGYDRALLPYEARGGKRLVEAVVFAVDVEVAERDQVVVPAVLGLRPSGKPFRDRFEFGDTVGGC